MGRKKKQITAIEDNAIMLMELDSHKRDRTITITEFKQIKDEYFNQMFDKKIADWNDFKRQFIDYQGTLGFTWSNSQGYAGPIKLESIDLQTELGSELAEKLHKEETSSGDFVKDVLKRFLPELFKYLEDEISLLNMTDAKEEFKIPDETSGYGFKFKQNSTKFERKLLEYKYISENGKQHEVGLGEIIKESLQNKFILDFIYHSQLEREGQKYKNIDIEGVRIIRTESEDYFELYAFELKATNSIHAISESISQAINYKSCSNYTYIIIPNFDFENFYDEVRLREYIEMCRQNAIGIISLVMKGNKLQDLNILLEASKTDRTDHTRIISLSNKIEFIFEKCHLCGKIVHKEHRKNCGWRISLENEEVSHCMKLLQQEQIEDFLKRVRGKIDIINDATVIKNQ